MSATAKDPRVIGRRHEIADCNIRRFQGAIARAERGEGRANISHCRAMIDKWLEYRLGPNDERRL